ncbi:hypothetical protein [Peribacillus sp. SCS-155]|uniref:hypothetical protein n=1 Tax=Peribacillus sedimenti TaxID=3115297 RepID=UPI0039060DEC
MRNELIAKFRDKGIIIEKTKSRHEVFSSVYETDPSLLAFEAPAFTEHFSKFNSDNQK